MLIAKENMKA